MTIEIYSPLSFSEIGQRSGNEDWLFPAVDQADETSNLFIVCDGMGGADKGEVASQLLTEGVACYLTQHPQTILDGNHLTQAMTIAGRSYAEYMQANPFMNRMGSTLALLQLHQQGITIAHLGDSRVFHIRDGEIIFQTKDHKQVNEMVAAGIISEQQAQTHPWRNKLSRAAVINATDLLSETFHLDTPDIKRVTDVRPNDYFFLCTDGTLEQITEQLLSIILKMPVSDKLKLQILLQLCADKVKDNYSGHLIHIKQVIP